MMRFQLVAEEVEYSLRQIAMQSCNTVEYRTRLATFATPIFPVASGKFCDINIKKLGSGPCFSFIQGITQV